MARTNTKDPTFENYPHTLVFEDDRWWITFPDLPGCMADGETETDAIAQGRSAFAYWMHSCIQDGHTPPTPQPITTPPPMGTGKLLARLPKSLHGRLAATAKREGVSINQLITAFIAQGLSAKT